jgi:dihydroorotase
MADSESLNLLIKNGHIIDPLQGIDGVGEILIRNGKVKEIKLHGAASGKADEGSKRSSRPSPEIFDARGFYVLPGLIDMHVHLREPGFEYKETIKTGTWAAIKGGFTSVCSMPNTMPVNDNETVTEFILRKASSEGACTVYPIGAITKGQKGEELAEMGTMIEAGCVAFSDDGRPVVNSLLMRRALEYSKVFGATIISHAEDLYLSSLGVMNEGPLSVSLGLRGIPAEAEVIMIKRDIELAGLTGGKLHIAHVSTAGGVRAIGNAKRAGINVTAETCPQYFTITEEAIEGYNTNAKINPPLRRTRDIDAIKDGLADGTLDVIASDHAPHHRDEKLCEFDKAASGISGLETSLALSLSLVEDGILSLSQLVQKMAVNPSAILGLNEATLGEGIEANIVIVDNNRKFRIDAARFSSKGKNTPFHGREVKGMPVAVICQGRIQHVKPGDV